MSTLINMLFVTPHIILNLFIAELRSWSFYCLIYPYYDSDDMRHTYISILFIDLEGISNKRIHYRLYK